MNEEKIQKSSSSISNTQKKYSIICKFWMSGNCMKEEKCEYLHEIMNPRIYNKSSLVNSNQQKVCPFYKLGFCKNGVFCNFNHIQQPEENLPNYVPIWFLEYLYEKPISLIFEEFEDCNPEETLEIKEKISNEIKIKNTKKQ